MGRLLKFPPVGRAGLGPLGIPIEGRQQYMDFKAQIEQDLESLRKQREQALKNALTLEGAIQYAQAQIQRLDAQAAQEAEAVAQTEKV